MINLHVADAMPVVCTRSDWSPSVLGGAYAAANTVRPEMCPRLVGTASVSLHGARSHAAAG